MSKRAIAGLCPEILTILKCLGPEMRRFNRSVKFLIHSKDRLSDEAVDKQRASDGPAGGSREEQAYIPREVCIPALCPMQYLR